MPFLYALATLLLSAGGLKFASRYSGWFVLVAGASAAVQTTMLAVFFPGGDYTNAAVLFLLWSAALLAVGAELMPRFVGTVEDAKSAQARVEEDLMRLRNQIGAQGYGFAPDGTVEGGLPPRSERVPVRERGDT